MPSKSVRIFGATKNREFLAMIKLWNAEEVWSLYRNTWPGPNWVVIGLLADWVCIVDDTGNLYPIQYITRRLN